MSTEESKLVKEARELLRCAAPGPWFWTLSYEMPSGRKHWALKNAESEARDRIIDASLVLQHTRPTYLDRECPTLPNWQLIARAPELISQLCDEVEELTRRNATQADSIMEFQEEQKSFRAVLRECLPYVLSSAEASRMMDGFEPQEHDEDRLAQRMFDVIGDEELREQLTPGVVKHLRRSAITKGSEQ